MRELGRREVELLVDGATALGCDVAALSKAESAAREPREGVRLR